jgi:hypothetical protein
VRSPVAVVGLGTTRNEEARNGTRSLASLGMTGDGLGMTGVLGVTHSEEVRSGTRSLASLGMTGVWARDDGGVGSG